VLGAWDSAVATDSDGSGPGTGTGTSTSEAAVGMPLEANEVPEFAPGSVIVTGWDTAVGMAVETTDVPCATSSGASVTVKCVSCTSEA